MVNMTNIDERIHSKSFQRGDRVEFDHRGSVAYGVVQSASPTGGHTVLYTGNRKIFIMGYELRPHLSSGTTSSTVPSET